MSTDRSGTSVPRSASRTDALSNRIRTRLQHCERIDGRTGGVGQLERADDGLELPPPEARAGRGKLLVVRVVQDPQPDGAHADTMNGQAQGRILGGHHVVASVRADDGHVAFAQPRKAGGPEGGYALARRFWAELGAALGKAG